MSPRRGPDLPYSLVAAATPCGSRWLVASAKMHAATFAPEEPRLYATFSDVLSERPSFQVVVTNTPVGFLEAPGMGVRTCDREARQLLGRRGSAVRNAPTLAVLRSEGRVDGDQLDAVSATLLPRYREVVREMSPYRQRVVYEGHPELSFYQLNGGQPLRWSKKVAAGREERRSVLESKIQGVQRIVDAQLPRVPSKHLYDVAALLWTARRVLGHAAKRLPADAQWDSEGLRMEYVY